MNVFERMSMNGFRNENETPFTSESMVLGSAEILELYLRKIRGNIETLVAQLIICEEMLNLRKGLLREAARLNTLAA